MDLVYTNIKNAYRAAPLPHIGNSDHLTVMTPAYRPQVKQEPLALKEIRVCAAPSLQGCFECTQWHIFKVAATCEDFIDLQE